MNIPKAKPDFSKINGLVPVIVQNASTSKVLMLGFMNEEAWNKTLQTGLATFYSRSRNKLWTKGEESGNILKVVELISDCDNDTILLIADPVGPTCHTGTESCFGSGNPDGLSFLGDLQRLIIERKKNLPENSYTTRLFNAGINKIAQKVGEEAVELVIEAKDDNRDLFINEAADLMYHYLVLLAAKGMSVEEVISVLKERHT
jgi:phosphoribosyl-AMP cyclohydrolase / phosphoribosyl-ATP pyrophosphohydrolase